MPTATQTADGYSFRTRSAQQRATDQTNEFIADFVDNHGHNQATRDEAYQTVSRLERMAQDVVNLVAKYSAPDDAENTTEYLIGALSDGRDEADLASYLVAAIIEKMAEASS